FPGVLGKDVRRRMADISDGTSNTLLLAESAGRDPLYQMGKFVSLTGGGRGSWGNPGNVINLTGFNPATTNSPGPCAANCTNNNEAVPDSADNSPSGIVAPRTAAAGWRRLRPAGTDRHALRRPAAVCRQGSPGHLPLHERRAVASRYVRSQTGAS